MWSDLDVLWECNATVAHYLVNLVKTMEMVRHLLLLGWMAMNYCSDPIYSRVAFCQRTNNLRKKIKNIKIYYVVYDRESETQMNEWMLTILRYYRVHKIRSIEPDWYITGQQIYSILVNLCWMVLRRITSNFMPLETIYGKIEHETLSIDAI